MMRSPRCMAVAVRRPGGGIVVLDRPWRSIWERLRFLRRPFLRGSVVLVESIANGMSALSYSARVAGEAAAAAGDGAGETDGRPPPRAISPAWILVPTLIVALAVFKGVPHVVALGLDSLAGGAGVSGRLFHVVDGLAKLALFLGYIVLISRMEEIRRVFAYHGAEHKAIATFEAGEDLAVPNARGRSRFHPRCGTSFMLVVILVGVLLYMLVLPAVEPLTANPWLDQALLVLLKIVMLLPIAGVSYEAIRLSARWSRNPLVRLLTWPGMLTQRLTTREPTDEQIEVALASLGTVLAREAAGEEKAPAEREAVFADFAAFVCAGGQSAASRLDAPRTPADPPGGAARVLTTGGQSAASRLDAPRTPADPPGGVARVRAAIAEGGR